MPERWALFSNHGTVLAYVISHNESTVREIALGAGITERATLAILRMLDDDGVIARHRDGRRNTYSVNFDRLSTFRRAAVAPLSPPGFVDGLVETLLRLNTGRSADEGPRRPATGSLHPPSGSWGFFTNHLRMLIAVAIDATRTVGDLARLVGITERAAVTILKQLEEAGLIERRRDGRRNTYLTDYEALRSFDRWTPGEWPMPREVSEFVTRGLREVATRGKV